MYRSTRLQLLSPSIRARVDWESLALPLEQANGDVRSC